MTLPLILLLVMATIGSIDGSYYHTYKFELFRQPSARLETVTHVFRAYSLAIAAWVLVHYIPQGVWYWALVALFALDFLDDVVDVLIEPKSRAPLGGLPPFEYLIHMLVMGLSGAIWVTFIVGGFATRSAPSALVPYELSWWLLWYGRIVAVGAVLMGTMDALRLAMSLRKARA